MTCVFPIVLVFARAVSRFPKAMAMMTAVGGLLLAPALTLRAQTQALTSAQVPGAGDEGVRARLVWQPVIDYLVKEPALSRSRDKGVVLKLNPFVSYTNLGTDFGFHGPGEAHLLWELREVRAPLSGSEDWAGMWHSLSGLAAVPGQALDPLRFYTPLVVDAAQPRLASVQVLAGGRGRLKLEIKGPGQELAWQETLEIAETAPRPYELALPPNLSHAKLLNWTAEPGSDLTLHSLRLGLQMPPMTFDRYVLLASYAKLARCYVPELGLVSDRAHLAAGTFDSLPATGLFALATAAASQPGAELVTADSARRVLRDIEAAMARIPKARGLLPHFVKRGADGVSRIAPGTEYSTIDTSLCYHSLLLAAEMLGEEAVKNRVLEAIRAVNIPELTLEDGAISHGLRDDGRTLLPYSWKDWGGETALVLLLARLSGTEPKPSAMHTDGKPWQGTGFIAELQSLFYPDFDSTTPDAVSHVDWLATRRGLLAAQKAYFPESQPESAAARLGLYGLSAGEGAWGTSYDVGGVDLPDQRLIHPHYILLSGTVEEDPQAVYRLMETLEEAGWFTPLGLAENIMADGSRSLPMIGGLNAGFEALGAYHLLAKARGLENAIHRASVRNAELREAIRLFYPAGQVAAK